MLRRVNLIVKHSKKTNFNSTQTYRGGIFLRVLMCNPTLQNNSPINMLLIFIFKLQLMTFFLAFHTLFGLQILKQMFKTPCFAPLNHGIEEEEEERLLWQINNYTMLYMISFATETPIKTCNMSLAWEPPYNIMI